MPSKVVCKETKRWCNMSKVLRKKYIESDYERLHTRLVEEGICETELDKHSWC